MRKERRKGAAGDGLGWALGQRLGQPSPATHAGLSHTSRQCTHSSRHMRSPLASLFPGPLIFQPTGSGSPLALGSMGLRAPWDSHQARWKKTGERILNQEGKAKRMAGGSTGGPSGWAESPGVL